MGRVDMGGFRSSGFAACAAGMPVVRLVRTTNAAVTVKAGTCSERRPARLAREGLLDGGRRGESSKERTTPEHQHARVRIVDIASWQRRVVPE